MKPLVLELVDHKALNEEEKEAVYFYLMSNLASVYQDILNQIFHASF